MLFGLLIQSTVAFRRGHATIKNSKYPMEKKEFFLSRFRFNGPPRWHIVLELIVTLRASEAAEAQCIVIGPVCGFVCVSVWVYLFVCGSVTTISRNSVHRYSPNWVCR